MGNKFTYSSILLAVYTRRGSGVRPGAQGAQCQGIGGQQDEVASSSDLLMSSCVQGRQRYRHTDIFSCEDSSRSALDFSDSNHVYLVM